MRKFTQPLVVEKRGYSAVEARRYIGIGKSKFFTLLNCGELQGRRAGGRLLFLKDDLDRYLDRLPVRAVGDHAGATRSARS